MAIESKNRFDLKLPKSNKVVVVGAGPVGLVASLLLPFSYAQMGTLPG
jgi:threonine dehydrogenase-like Zn-dependent dehydrogenase